MAKKNEKETSGQTHHAYGTWVPRTTISKILVCACGNKYIKTRLRQSTCIRCMQK